MNGVIRLVIIPKHDMTNWLYFLVDISSMQV